MKQNIDTHQFFHKKVHASIYKPSKINEEETRIKKIIPSTKINGIKDDFKKVFLPLLVEVFELRKRIENYKNGTKCFLSPQDTPSCPIEILTKLQTLQKEVEESQRWCDGVIVQISKGIEEAKEALHFIDEKSDKSVMTKKKSSLFCSLVNLFKKHE